MNLRHSCMVVLLLAFTGCESVTLRDSVNSLLAAGSGELDINTIASGLKEALKVGTERASGQLAKKGGYSSDPLLRIPVPPELEKVASTMRKVGLGALVDTLEGKMNTAAETAAGKAKPLFWDAIKQMTFQDARNILQGDDTEATDYFRAKIGGRLRDMYGPIVEQHLNSVGAVKTYNQLVDRYAALPFTKKPSFDLESYATEKALDGLFSVLAVEEKRIRENPAARTTELLRRVFARQ